MDSGPEFSSPHNELPPEHSSDWGQWCLRRRLGLCERLVARMTLTLANPRIRGRRRDALRKRIAELEAEIIELRGRIARVSR
jgi:hypothetical protein